ncbi:ARMT1-like domain-containing protein [Streptomyces sp. NPDC008079]|uniref:damage-control phosphatase ARMT1 family protein n=1 Tax=Streptomyces sp. NPDC008079 TaxID=3364806 RepID=UPI0036E8CB11
MSGTPGSFARSVLADRHPALIRQVADAFPYPPEQRRALDALAEETAAPASADATSGPPIGPLSTRTRTGTDTRTDDVRRWAEWGAEAYVGRASWYEVPFLWAESYFYRRLLDAVGYFGPGPWQGVDPFAPFKRAELTGPEVADELAALDALDDLAPDDRDRAVLQGALWGNRADLGFRISANGPTAHGSTAEASSTKAPSAEAPTAEASSTNASSANASSTNTSSAHASPTPAPTSTPSDDLLADDSAALWRHLAAAPPGTAAVTVIADNAGRELIPDLILIDHLLHTGRAATAVLHVKPYPYFVSDATTSDVVDCLRRIGQAPGRRARETGARLWSALGTGRLVVRAHPFACAPLPYADMPADLRAELGRATLTVLKGDLNYRRLVGDRLWSPTTEFSLPTGYFPSPLAALRTLKSDVIVGLDAGTVTALDANSAANGGAWRTSGTYAVVQVRTV